MSDGEHKKNGGIHWTNAGPKLLEWLLNQGPITVLLAAILAGIYHAVTYVGPQVVSAINESHQAIEDKQTQQLEQLIEHDRLQYDRLIEMHREERSRDREFYRSILDAKK